MIEVNIRKPVYGNFVYIRDIYLRQAIRQGCKLRITVPRGSAIVDPREWIKNGKRMEKIFKRPDQPMILYGGNVPIPGEKGKVVENTKPEFNQEKLF